jgi:hypothetical protein
LFSDTLLDVVGGHLDTSGTVFVNREHALMVTQCLTNCCERVFVLTDTVFQQRMAMSAIGSSRTTFIGVLSFLSNRPRAQHPTMPFAG